MTKISQLSSIGDSLAIGDQFLIRDIDDAGSPNKSVTVSGITRALADGDATAPALAFAADKNTGIYRAGTDSLAVATNGTGRLFVDSTGRVGVGISSPNGSFHIAATTPSFYFTDTDATGLPQSALLGTDGNFSYYANENNVTGGNHIFLRNGSSESVRITSAGRVGIGTSSVSEFLHIKGGTSGGLDPTVLIANGAPATSETASVDFGFNTQVAEPDVLGRISTTMTNRTSGAQASTLAFSVASSGSLSPRMTLTGTGLGIGSSAPAEKLEVQNGSISVGQSSNTSQTNVLIAGYGYILSATKYGNTSIRSTYENADNTASLEFYTSNGATTSTERARIDSSGRLLIGTSTARANFSIGGTGYAPQTQFEGGVIQASVVRASSPVIGLAAIDAAASGTSTGNISFFGNDGTNLIRTADITSAVDGTPGANDMPGRLVFSVTADGAASPTEAMRIKSTGIINFSNAPTYADNTAATAGGLAVGDVYKTVLGVLMIRF